MLMLVRLFLDWLAVRNVDEAAGLFIHLFPIIDGNIMKGVHELFQIVEVPGDGNASQVFGICHFNHVDHYTGND